MTIVSCRVIPSTETRTNWPGTQPAFRIGDDGASTNCAGLQIEIAVREVDIATAIIAFAVAEADLDLQLSVRGTLALSGIDKPANFSCFRIRE